MSDGELYQRGVREGIKVGKAIASQDLPPAATSEEPEADIYATQRRLVAALAHTEPVESEPVGWITPEGLKQLQGDEVYGGVWPKPETPFLVPLYTHPAEPTGAREAFNRIVGFVADRATSDERAWFGRDKDLVYAALASQTTASEERGKNEE